MVYILKARKIKGGYHDISWQVIWNFIFNIFYCLCYYSCPIFSFIPLWPEHPLPPAFPHFSSCPWIVHISSLASIFPIPFLTYPCLFSTYHYATYFLYLSPLSLPFTPSHSPTFNPPCDLHFCGSVPVLVICLVCFCFCFWFDMLIVVFVVILLFIFLIFFLGKSL